MKYKKRGNPDPPGSTLCSAESLDKLRTEFEVPDEVEFSVPKSSNRADDPPPGYFTMYENSLEGCFLTFPIPSAENLAAGVETNLVGGQEDGFEVQPIVSGEISEVAQEKPKKSRRSKKPPRVPVSDGVIPSSEPRASASGTALEQDGGSHSTRRHKKRSRRSSSVGQVQSPVRAVLTDGISESVIDDSKTAAWFANIQYHDSDRPLPAELVADPDFGLMSRHGSRASPEALRSWRAFQEIVLRRSDSIRNRNGAQKECGIRVAGYQRRCVEAEERAVEESAKASILQRQLADEKTGLASRIKRATKAAMRTLATKFQGKIDRAKEKIRTLSGNPKKKLVQLAQVEANIEFARILRETLTRTARDDVSLETLAMDVGVRAFDGSITDELGVNRDDDEYVNIVD
ncbi:hypothetical protein AALP_AAs62936U000100 [Arabis alpina]|uniref:Uncharacterized protein n=1 Tax=Arabis alpina TaxID=50452 RepID=A0A087G153_ARAAL|nr:hypothetical protein AALP_AAs62936U000100 [Arabis alpina]